MAFPTQVYANRHRLRQTIALAILVCLPAGSTVAAPAARPSPRSIAAEYVQTAWDTEDDLPQNSVTAIVQTRDGYLWVGTFGGLARFDGLQFTVFNSSNSPGLLSSRIVALHEDRHGVLWIGTEGGLARYERGRFTTLTSRDGLPHDTVFSLAEDRPGRLWIGTGQGAAVWDGTRLAAVALPRGANRLLVWAMAEDATGAMWIGTRGGIVRVRDADTAFFDFSAESATSGIVSLLADSKGRVWVGTTEMGLGRLESGRFVRVPLPGGLASYGWVRALAEDRRGHIWIGTGDGGVYRWRDGAVDQHATRDGLPHNTLRAIHTDREGNIWIGTDVAGLVRLRPRRAFPVQRGDRAGNESVVPIVDDGEGGLWVGATCGGVLHLRDGEVEVLDEKDGVPWPCVWALHRDPDGTLWVGTSGRGLASLKEGRATRFRASDGLASDSVSAIVRDRGGALWIGTNAGVSRLEAGRFQTFRRQDGLVHDDVRFIVQDRAGALWFGTVGGLSRLQGGRFANYTTAEGLSHNYVRAVHEDADGALWIGTYGGGLNRLKDGRFTHYGPDVGLFDSVVSRIIEDERGRLWMSGNRGIFHVSRAELNAFADGRVRSVTSVAYGTAEGMPTNETNGGGQPAGWRTPDGRLWFPTIRGVVAIDPTVSDDSPPVVVVERVVAGQQAVDFARPVTLGPRIRDLEFHYTALELGAPESVRFKYRLEGYDDTWVDAGARRVAYYTNVPSGPHRFQVIARNADGVWNDSGAAVAFAITPRFYETTPFFALCGTALLVLGVSTHRLRVAHLARRARSLERTVADRTAEVVEQRNALADAKQRLERSHDDLLAVLDRLRLGVVMTDGSGLVTFLSEAAERLLGTTEEDAAGRAWEQVLPLTAHDMGRVKAAAALPEVRRDKVPVQARTPGGRRYWMEIEIKDDPRQPNRRIFVLYDVSEVYDLRRVLDEKSTFVDLVGQTTAIQLVYKQIRDLARVDTTVLVEGETGTGKELVARAIHRFSARSARPFVAVNCAGLTESLLTSQLFGHVRGAFTGATADHAGFFESANGGTVLLDEIGGVPLNVQTNLLRVLQEREITRLGESRPRKIDVRIVAASNHDLTQEIAAGRFRADLLYRIRVARIHLPLLRERLEDIPLLVARFLEEWRATTGRPVPEVSSDVIDRLQQYQWPGNVRELKNAIESALIGAAGPILRLADLPPEVVAAGSPLSPPQAASPSEREAIVDALRRAGGNRTKAARLLGIARRTLYRRMEATGIQADLE